MAQIFISYRRADSTQLTGRLYDRLANYWGKDSVFYDVASIAPGTDFSHELQAKIAASDVMLVIIGPQWAHIVGEDGNPRLHDPADYVRQEVEQGLRDCKRVIPVLIDGASIPSAADLPVSLQRLALLNAFTIDNEPRFRHDAERFVNKLDELLAQDVRGYRSPAINHQRSKPGPLSSLRNWLLLAAVLLFAAAGVFVMMQQSAQVAFLNPAPTLEGDTLLRMDLSSRTEQDAVVQLAETAPMQSVLSHNIIRETDEYGRVRIDSKASVVRAVLPDESFTISEPETVVIYDLSRTPALPQLERGTLYAYKSKVQGVPFSIRVGDYALSVRLIGSSARVSLDDNEINVACLAGTCTIGTDDDPTPRVLSGDQMITFSTAALDYDNAQAQPVPAAYVTPFENYCANCVNLEQQTLVAVARTATATPLVFPTVTPSSTNTPVPTDTPTSTGTPTPTPTSTSTVTSTPTLTPTPEPRINVTSSFGQQIRDRGYVRIAASAAGLWPMNFVDENGDFAGFEIDLAHSLVDLLFGADVEIEFVPLSAAERFTAMEAGEIDLMIRYTTHTRSRAELIAFTATNYFLDGQRILIPADLPAETLADLDGLVIGVMGGTTTQMYLEDAVRQAGLAIEVRPFENTDAALRGFLDGTNNAISADWTHLLSLIGAEGITGEGFRIIGDLLSKEPFAIGVPIYAEDFRDEVDEALLVLIEDGTWQSHYDEWFTEPPPWTVEQMMQEPRADR